MKRYEKEPWNRQDFVDALTFFPLLIAFIAAVLVGSAARNKAFRQGKREKAKRLQRLIEQLRF